MARRREVALFLGLVLLVCWAQADMLSVSEDPAPASGGNSTAAAPATPDSADADGDKPNDEEKCEECEKKEDAETKEEEEMDKEKCPPQHEELSPEQLKNPKCSKINAIKEAEKEVPIPKIPRCRKKDPCGHEESEEAYEDREQEMLDEAEMKQLEKEKKLQEEAVAEAEQAYLDAKMKAEESSRVMDEAKEDLEKENEDSKRIDTKIAKMKMDKAKQDKKLKEQELLDAKKEAEAKVKEAKDKVDEMTKQLEAVRAKAEAAAAAAGSSGEGASGAVKDLEDSGAMDDASGSKVMSALKEIQATMEKQQADIDTIKAKQAQCKCGSMMMELEEVKASAKLRGSCDCSGIQPVDQSKQTAVTDTAMEEKSVEGDVDKFMTGDAASMKKFAELEEKDANVASLANVIKGGIQSLSPRVNFNGDALEAASLKLAVDITSKAKAGQAMSKAQILQLAAHTAKNIKEDK